MLEQEFNDFLERISKQLPVSMLAKPAEVSSTEKLVNVEGSMPAFEAMELLAENDCLMLDCSQVVRKEFFLKKRPLRILFFLILTELESRLYRIQEWNGKPIKELNEKHLNNFIALLVSDKKLFSCQKEYSSKKEFKEDLKAASSFRNLIVHVNKKLEMETNFKTVLKRKHQMLKLLKALNEVLAGLKKKGKNAA